MDAFANEVRPTWVFGYVRGGLARRGKTNAGFRIRFGGGLAAYVIGEPGMLPWSRIGRCRCQQGLLAAPSEQSRDSCTLWSGY